MARWPLLVSILLLIVAALGMLPHGFLLLTRALVCASALYAAGCAHARNQLPWLWALLALALLLNPVFPVHVPRLSASVLNWATALTLIVFVATAGGMGRSLARR